MTEQKDEGLEIVERLEDVPAFAHEDDEARYWATHALGDAILDQMGPVEDGFLPSPRPRTTPRANSLQRGRHPAR